MQDITVRKDVDGESALTPDDVKIVAAAAKVKEDTVRKVVRGGYTSQHVRTVAATWVRIKSEGVRQLIEAVQ